MEPKQVTIHIPKPISAVEHYWDHEKFRAYIFQEFGNPTEASRYFTRDQSSFWRWWRGDVAPDLESYVRIHAIFGLPLGRFLHDGVVESWAVPHDALVRLPVAAEAV